MNPQAGRVLSKLRSIHKKYHEAGSQNHYYVLDELRNYLRAANEFGVFRCDVNSNEFIPVYNALERTFEDFLSSILRFVDIAIKRCIEEEILIYEEDELC